MKGRANLELDRPRSIWEMLTAAFQLYWRIPVLFLVLAAIVVVPYELIVLAITGAGPFAQGHLGFIASKGLLALDSFLITPLISAFHVRAVREVGDGGRPGLASTVRQSLPRLPVVAVAAGISGIAIVLGDIAFAIPGLFLAAIWPVVAQAAALERVSWIGALRRSTELTRGYRWHALGLVICAGLIPGVPLIPITLIFGHKTTTAASFLAGTAFQVLARSFEALVTALLYFDLTARPRGGAPHIGVPEWDPNVPVSEAPSGIGDPLAPNGYTDQSRPRGWYIDPSQPKRMRYWAAGYKPVWSQRTTKTPRQTLVEWEELNARREEAAEKA
ncbi:MAG TPA: hypothetical protein VH299_14060 [Solirubrobacterales bacterium]|jgi:hypothetical protein|nr:hypothetical protein [Solirubrobacterales bacterium]